MKTPRAFFDLSTRLMKDLKDWSEEATSHNLLSPEDLKSLQEAADTIERVTLTVAEANESPADR